MPNLNNLTTQDVQWGSDLWNNGFKNYLINGDFAINQRAFPGGYIGGVVTSTTITAGGDGYTSAPTVAFGAPPAGGTQATGTAVITSGVVTSITINNPGAGYTSAPAVTLTGGGFTTAATATCAVNSTTGTYAFDRWKSGSSACSCSLSSGVLTHTSGPLVQVIEAPNLAGKTITVSVEGLSGGSLNVDVEGVTGIIAASASRAGVTLAVPSTSTGNVTVTLTPASGEVTYKRVQVELGSVATGFEWRPQQIETDLAQRYFWQGVPSGSGINTNIYTGSAYQSFFIQFPVRMRSVPAASQTGVSLSVALDSTYGINLSPSTNGCRILVRSVSSGGSSNAFLTWDTNGVTSFFTMDAEL